MLRTRRKMFPVREHKILTPVTDIVVVVLVLGLPLPLLLLFAGLVVDCVVLNVCIVEAPVLVLLLQ